MPIFFWTSEVPKKIFQKLLKKHHTVELHQKGTILHHTFILTHPVYIQLFFVCVIYVTSIYPSVPVYNIVCVMYVTSMYPSVPVYNIVCVMYVTSIYPSVPVFNIVCVIYVTSIYRSIPVFNIVCVMYVTSISKCGFICSTW